METHATLTLTNPTIQFGTLDPDTSYYYRFTYETGMITINTHCTVTKVGGSNGAKVEWIAQSRPGGRKFRGATAQVAASAYAAAFEAYCAEAP
jgi:hypothetical protein